MGNRVDGSCLSYYSNIGNFWSVATNAVEVNKPVFYIYDQDGNMIGRLLAAITDNKQLIRFSHIYTKGNVQVDLDTHMNTYLREFAQHNQLETS